MNYIGMVSGKNGWLQVISAVDIALYDLVSKSKKLPLYKFLKFKKKKVLNCFVLNFIGQLAMDLRKRFIQRNAIKN